MVFLEAEKPVGRALVASARRPDRFVDANGTVLPMVPEVNRAAAKATLAHTRTSHLKATSPSPGRRPAHTPLSGELTVIEERLVGMLPWLDEVLATSHLSPARPLAQRMRSCSGTGIARNTHAAAGSAAAGTSLECSSSSAALAVEPNAPCTASAGEATSSPIRTPQSSFHTSVRPYTGWRRWRCLCRGGTRRWWCVLTTPSSPRLRGCSRRLRTPRARRERVLRDRVPSVHLLPRPFEGGRRVRPDGFDCCKCAHVIGCAHWSL